MVLSAGRRPVTRSVARQTSSLSAPGGVRKDSPLTWKVERVAAADSVERPLQPVLQRGAGPAVVEADVEGGARLARNDVGGGVADVDGGDLQRRRLEMRGAFIERARRHRVQHGDEAMRRVIGKMRVGGMALDAMHREEAVHAAAPADLNHVAQHFGIGRLADDAGVERLAPRPDPLQELLGAVDRRRLPRRR